MATNVAGRMQGKKALITGASRGIGFAIAEAFAREGADLVISASSEASLENVKKKLAEYDCDVSCAAADLSQESGVNALFEFALQKHPDLDVVVNNAGIRIGKPFTEYSMDELDQVMKINVYSVFQMMQLAIRHMQGLGRGNAAFTILEKSCNTSLLRPSPCFSTISLYKF